MLTAEQTALVEDYARQYDPVAMLRKSWASSYDAAIFAGMDEIDIESAAWEGVMRAAERFDTSRQCSFPSYCTWWIRSKVSHHARNTDRSNARQAGCRLIAADASPAEGRSTFWHLLGVSDPTRPESDPEEFDLLDELRRRVRRALAMLLPRHRLALELRYGLTGGDCRSMDEVGEIMGVSKQRIQQIHVQAIGTIGTYLERTCGEYMRFGRNPKTRLYVGQKKTKPKGTRATSCSTCLRPFPSEKYRRCFTCHPTPKKG